MATVTGLYMMTNIAYLTVMTRTELLASEAVGSVSSLLGSYRYHFKKLLSLKPKAKSSRDRNH